MLPAQFVGSKQQRSLRQLAAVEAVFGITYRTDRYYHLHLRIYFLQYANGFRKSLTALVYRKFLLLKQPLWTFSAVINNLASLLQAIDMVRAEGEDADPSLTSIKGRSSNTRRLAGVFYKALDSMEHTYGIIHYAIGIHHGAELILQKASAYVVGKTRTDKQHTFKRTYAECRFIYVHFCSELHNKSNEL